MNTRVNLTPIDGVCEIVSHPARDLRGSFLNAYPAEDSAFVNLWGSRRIAQVNLSQTQLVGTVRGLHLQAAPYSEAKLVRCIRGRIWDVAVDLRPSSPMWGQWFATELSPDMSNALFIPEGCAHGFQVLEPGSEILYLHSETWKPEAETGIRFDDPELAISWPLSPQGLSERDLALPLLGSLT